MKKISINGLIYKAKEYEYEDEIEKDFFTVYKQIIGNDTLLFDKRKIRTISNIGTIPDGFAVSLSRKQWYVIEVELAKHPLDAHIGRQINTMKRAIKHSETKKQLTKEFYRNIKENNQISLAKKYCEDVHELITEIIEDRKPEFIIAIDLITEELEDTIQTADFNFNIIQLESYANGEKPNDKVLVFDVLDAAAYQHSCVDNSDRAESVIEKHIVNISERVDNGQTPAALQQIVEVIVNISTKRISYNEAVQIVANQRNISYQSVADKCTRQLGIDTDKFKILVEQKNIKDILVKRFPTYGKFINDNV